MKWCIFYIFNVYITKSKVERELCENQNGVPHTAPQAIVQYSLLLHKFSSGTAGGLWLPVEWRIQRICVPEKSVELSNLWSEKLADRSLRARETPASLVKSSACPSCSMSPQRGNQIFPGCSLTVVVPEMSHPSAVSLLQEAHQSENFWQALVKKCLLCFYYINPLYCVKLVFC